MEQTFIRKRWLSLSHQKFFSKECFARVADLITVARDDAAVQHGGPCEPTLSFACISLAINLKFCSIMISSNRIPIKLMSLNREATDGSPCTCLKYVCVPCSRVVIGKLDYISTMNTWAEMFLPNRYCTSRLHMFASLTWPQKHGRISSLFVHRTHILAQVCLS